MNTEDIAKTVDELRGGAVLTKSILETLRLDLREMRSSDLDFVAEMLGDPEVMRHWPRCYSAEEAKDWIRRQQERYEQSGYGYWIVHLKETRDPIGQVGLLEIEVDGKKETGLGYIIHRPFWRRGFASEAAEGAVNYAFTSLQKSRVVCLIRPENAPSLGVARKLGFELEKSTMFYGLEHFVFALSKPAPP